MDETVKPLSRKIWDLHLKSLNEKNEIKNSNPEVGKFEMKISTPVVENFEMKSANPYESKF